MRLKSACIQSANVLTAKVLAKPGTPSRRTCPFASSPTMSRSTRYFCPTMTLPISCLSKLTQAASLLILSCSSGAGGLFSVIDSFISLKRLRVKRTQRDDLSKRKATRNSSYSIFRLAQYGV